MSRLPRLIPCTSNVKPDGEAGRLSAPTAVRNEAAILEVLSRHAPASGHGFEIASGTGQHSTAFARQHPNLTWQPSDIMADRLVSIRAWQSQSELGNLKQPVAFDATQDAWPGPAPDVVMLVNLLHLISDDEAWQLISNVSQAMAPGGKFLFYGPFLREGRTTNEPDRKFHHHLQATDPSIGYKNTTDIHRWLSSHNLQVLEVADMPANNLTWVAQKPN